MPPQAQRSEPIPAHLLTYCSADLPSTDGTFDQTTLALVGMYQKYGLCAADKAALVDWLEARKVQQPSIDPTPQLEPIKSTATPQTIPPTSGEPFVLPTE